MQRDAFEGETYLEAIPITAILTFIYLSAIWSDDGTAELPVILSLIGSDANLFFAAYVTSLLTASFGLAKALKTGPCRILPEGRLLSCRFLLLIFATLLTLTEKLSLVHLFITHTVTKSYSILLAFILSFAVVLLPGLFIALVSTWHSKMLKTFLIHPSFFILPIFTFFTFSSSRKRGMEVCHLRFSVKASLCNTFLSFLSFATFFAITVALDNSSEPTEDTEQIPWDGWMITLLPGFLLSLLFICIAKPTSKHLNLCSCCSSNEAAMDYAVYNPDQPTKEFLLRIADDGSEEVLPADQLQEDVEHVELKVETIEGLMQLDPKHK